MGWIVLDTSSALNDGYFCPDSCSKKQWFQTWNGRARSETRCTGAELPHIPDYGSISYAQATYFAFSCFLSLCVSYRDAETLVVAPVADLHLALKLNVAAVGKDERLDDHVGGRQRRVVDDWAQLHWKRLRASKWIASRENTQLQSWGSSKLKEIGLSCEWFPD